MCYAFCAVVMIGKGLLWLDQTQIGLMVRNGNATADQTKTTMSFSRPTIYMVGNGKLRSAARSPVTAGDYQRLPAATIKYT